MHGVLVHRVTYKTQNIGLCDKTYRLCGNHPRCINPLMGVLHSGQPQIGFSPEIGLFFGSGRRNTLSCISLVVRPARQSIYWVLINYKQETANCKSHKTCSNLNRRTVSRNIRKCLDSCIRLCHVSAVVARCMDAIHVRLPLL